jgi:Tol biopolymer transport system component
MESAVITATPAALNEIHNSPDGKWRIELVQYGCVDIGAGEGVKNSYEQLHLVNSDDGKDSIITDQLQYCEGIGAAGLGFVYWSPNSQYLYYTDSAYGVPDGGNRAWYPSLFRYDVGNGMTIDLRWGPLSPDGVTMAYPDQQKLVLYLWNLDKGEVARIPSSLSPDSPWPGIYDIAWSADGRYLVYIEAENSEGIGRAWITQLDTATFERRSIYQTESGQLCCPKWQNLGQIQFRLNNEVETLDLSPMHGNASPIQTTTPTP